MPGSAPSGEREALKQALGLPAASRSFPDSFAMLRGESGVPVFGIVGSTVPASPITVLSHMRVEDVFTKIVLLSVFTAVIPYPFSAAAQLYWLLVRGRAGLSPRRPTRARSACRRPRHSPGASPADRAPAASAQRPAAPR